MVLFVGTADAMLRTLVAGLMLLASSAHAANTRDEPCPAPEYEAIVPVEALAGGLMEELERDRLFQEIGRHVAEHHLFELLPNFAGEDWDALRLEYGPLLAAAESDLEIYELLDEMLRRFDTFGLTFTPYWWVEADADPSPERSGRIGAWFDRARAELRGEALTVVALDMDGPAAAAGLGRRDRILAVNGDECPSVEAITGPVGSGVTLTVQSPGAAAPWELVVVRSADVWDPVPHAWRLSEAPDVGYLWIPHFRGDIAVGVAEALDWLLGEEPPLRGLILDLRHNGGASPTQNGYDVLAHFVAGEVFGYYRHGVEYEPVRIQPSRLHGRLRAVPVMTLVDGATVATAESVAVGLWERGSAWLVGRATPGNTYLYGTFDLPDGSVLEILTHGVKFASGESIEEVGIAPDLEVDVDWTAYPENEDPYLLAALAYLEVLATALGPADADSGARAAASGAALDHDDWRARVAAARVLEELGSAGAPAAARLLERLVDRDATMPERSAMRDALIAVTAGVETRLELRLAEGIEPPFGWQVAPAGLGLEFVVAARTNGSLEPVPLPPGRYDVYWIGSQQQRDRPLLVAAGASVAQAGVSSATVDTGIRLTVADWVPARDPTHGWWGAVPAGSGPEERANWTASAAILPLPPGAYDLYWVQSYDHRNAPMRIAEGVVVEAGAITGVRAGGGIAPRPAPWVPSLDPTHGWWGVVAAGAPARERIHWSSSAEGLLLAPGRYDVYWVQDYDHRNAPLLLAADVAVERDALTELPVRSGISLVVPASAPELDGTFGWWGVARAGEGAAARVRWSVGTRDEPLLLAPGRYDAYWVQDYDHRNAPLLLAADVEVEPDALMELRVLAGIALEVPDGTAELDPTFGWWGVAPAGLGAGERVRWSTGRWDLPLVLPAGRYDVFWVQDHAQRNDPVLLAADVEVAGEGWVTVRADPRAPGGGAEVRHEVARVEPVHRPDATAGEGAGAAPVGEGEHGRVRAELATRLALLRDAYRAAELPPATVAALAATLGHDPHAAHAHLRHEFSYLPYAGVLRGAEGTFAARAGNGADLSLLLHALLAGAEPAPEMRFAVAELSAEQAARLVDEAVAAARGGATDPASLAGELFGGASADAPADSLEAAVRDLGLVLQDARASAELLRPAVADRAQDGAARARTAALAAARRHVWLQVRIDGAWVTLDPAADLPLPREGVTHFDRLPESWQHAVTVRLEVERLEGSAIVRELLAERELRTAELDGRAVEVRIAPVELLAEDVLAEEVDAPPLLDRIGDFDRFEALLAVAGEAPAPGHSFDLAGRAHAPAAGGLGFGSVNPFGALPSATTQESELAGVRLSFEFASPEAEAVTITRFLLDLIGPAARARGVFRIDPARTAAAPLALALMQHHQVLLPVAPLGLGRAAEEALAGLVHGEALERALDLQYGVFDGSMHDALDGLYLSALPAPLVAVNDRALALAASTTASARGFLAEPNLYLLSETMVLGGDGDVTTRTDVDIVRNRVQVIGDPVAAAELRLMHGLLASELEGRALQERGMAAATWAALTLRSAAQQGVRLVPVRSMEDLAGLALEADAAALIGERLLIGDTVLIPATHAPGQTPAWWSIDGDGHALAIGEGGRGQASTEGTLILEHISVPMVQRSMTYVSCFNRAVGGGASTSSAGGECMADMIKDQVKYALDNAIKQFAGDVLGSFDPTSEELYEAYKELHAKAKEAFERYQSGLDAGQIQGVDAGREAGAAGAEIGATLGFRMYLLLTMGSDIAAFATAVGR